MKLNLCLGFCLLALFFPARPTLAGVRSGSTPATLPVEVQPDGTGWLNAKLTNSALEEWDIGGQFRFRYEVTEDAGSFPNRDFISSGVDNDNDYFLFREKLHVGWQASAWLKLFAEAKGAQATSDDRPTSPGQDSMDLHQAFIDLGGAGRFPFSLKIGRQEMSYGDQRLIGVADWTNTGRSFDAARIRYHGGGKNWLDAFTGRVVIPRDDYFNESNDKDQFSGIYGSSQDLWSGVETQAYLLARNTGDGSPNAISAGVGGPSGRDVYTYGVRIKSLPDKDDEFDFSFEGAGQFGSVTSGSVNRDLKAYALTGTVGYTPNGIQGRPRIAIGYDYASGDSDPTDLQQETFEPLFGTNHPFYGIGDLVGLRNLSSPRVSLSAHPWKGLSLTADYLLFWLANPNDSFYPESGPGRTGNGYGKDSSLSRYLGSELDLYAKFQLSPSVETQIGYSHFFAGENIRHSINKVSANGGSTDADFFYTQISITF